jgi:flagellar hook-basal body protein
MYSAAAGMAAQQQRLDALSNDLANTGTTGYKKLRVAFRDLVYTPTGPGAAPGVQEGAGAAATLVGRGAAQGALQRTDRPLDVALQGPGFLQVRRADGAQVLTRDGNLQLDAQGASSPTAASRPASRSRPARPRTRSRSPPTAPSPPTAAPPAASSSSPSAAPTACRRSATTPSPRPPPPVPPALPAARRA